MSLQHDRTRRRALAAAAMAMTLTLSAACQEAVDPDQDADLVIEDGGTALAASEAFPGGDTTVERFDDQAFSLPAANLSFAERGDFTTGNFQFRQQQPGAGPHFSVGQCQACHILDGRGRPPASPDEAMRSMLMKVAAPDGVGGYASEPTYGGQIQTEGVALDASGLPCDGDPALDGAPLSEFEGALPVHGGCAIGEAYTVIEYVDVPGGDYPEGPAPTLRQPIYYVTAPSYGPFADGVVFSPRVSPPVFGLGLIGAIEEADIRALADPDDLDGDGISGRIRKVTFHGDTEPVLGRYGWKLGNPTVLAQTVAAFRGDIGVTTSILPEESCTPSQQACLDAAALEPNEAEGGVDIDDDNLAFVEFYTRTLGVPMNRGYDPGTGTWDPRVLAGRDRFYEVGCTDCHNPSFVTGEAKGSILGPLVGASVDPTRDAPPIEALSNQQIYPYTDLLLHDMGGECEPVSMVDAADEACTYGPGCDWVLRCTGLADGFPEGDAGPSEWRTAPLWGVGLAQTVTIGSGFLHDGRARTIEEAILWHGGEAAAAREAFMLLEQADRLDLIEFVESL